MRSRIRKKTLVVQIGDAFTLIELLVSMAILSLLLLLLAQLLDQVQQAWRYSESRVSQFREARVSFDIISKNLSQASLNTYWDYEYDEDNMVKRYKRQSELHFKTFPASELGSDMRGTLTGHAIAFQAPLGFSNTFRNLNNLFNARGYFLLYGDDRDYTPKILRNRLQPKERYRLMEYRPPAEENQIYIDGDQERLAFPEQPVKYTDWYRYKLNEFSHPLAENIVSLVIAPRDTLETVSDDRRQTYSRIAPDYTFNSNMQDDGGGGFYNERYAQQLPPLVRLTMVAIDETSAVRLEASNHAPPLVPNNLFRQSEDFEADVQTLKEQLQEKNVNHKVFSTMVAIRSAKWSTYNP